MEYIIFYLSHFYKWKVYLSYLTLFFPSLLECPLQGSPGCRQGGGDAATPYSGRHGQLERGVRTRARRALGGEGAPWCPIARRRELRRFRNVFAVRRRWEPRHVHYCGHPYILPFFFISTLSTFSHSFALHQIFH